MVDAVVLKEGDLLALAVHRGGRAEDEAVDAPPAGELQGRGALRDDLTEALRADGARLGPKDPNPGQGKRGKITDVGEFSKQPGEVEDRVVRCHWKGDLLLGRSGRSQMSLIVERNTRFVQVVALPENRKAATMRDAIATKITESPSSCPGS